MDQLLPWLALVPGVVVGAAGVLLVHRREIDWNLSLAAGVLLGAGVYALALVAGSLLYVSTLNR